MGSHVLNDMAFHHVYMYRPCCIKTITYVTVTDLIGGPRPSLLCYWPERLHVHVPLIYTNH